jgi:hypothetical protein
MLDIIQYESVLLGLAGTYLVTKTTNKNTNMLGMWFWICSNISAMTYFGLSRIWGFFILNLIYLILSIYGIYKRSK